jgi:hypothetical protein
MICVYERREKTAADSKPPIAIAKKRAEVIKSDFFMAFSLMQLQTLCA